MPVLRHDELTVFAGQMLRAVGTPDDIAASMAEALVNSNLKGVDSHGIIQIPYYFSEIDAGAINPAARPEVESKKASLAVMRGGQCYGIVALLQATDLAVEMARETGTGTVGLKQVHHTGRLGLAAERAVGAGMYLQIFCGGAHREWRSLAPFGGREPFFSTNPYALGVPGGSHGPVIIDMATSVVSDGKVAVYQKNGAALPDGWILNREGEPSTDPDDFFQGGMHLPAAGYKGYGMAMIAELVGDAALAAPPIMNWMVTAVDLAAFSAPEDYVSSADALIDKLKRVPTADGFDEILLPGELEQRAERERRTNGVPIPDSVWSELSAAAEKVGVSVPGQLADC